MTKLSQENLDACHSEVAVLNKGVDGAINHLRLRLREANPEMTGDEMLTHLVGYISTMIVSVAVQGHVTLTGAVPEKLDVVSALLAASRQVLASDFKNLKDQHDGNAP